MTASFETAELDLGTQAVLEDWIDYNGHMNVAYYVMAFDHGVDQFMHQIGITPPGYFRRQFPKGLTESPKDSCMWGLGCGKTAPEGPAVCHLHALLIWISETDRPWECAFWVGARPYPIRS